MKTAEKMHIQQKIKDAYIPLRTLILEDNEKEADVIDQFKNYSPALASVELVIYSFITANPETDDHEILHALKRIKKCPMHEFSHSEEDALAFAITYGLSRGLQQKRLAINEIHALLGWLIREVEERMQLHESYSGMLRRFFKVNRTKTGQII